MADREIKTKSITSLPGTVDENYDPEKGKITMTSAKYDWSKKATNMKDKIEEDE